MAVPLLQSTPRVNVSRNCGIPTLGIITIMKPWQLLDFGFTVAGLLVGIAIGIWTSLCFFYGHDGTLGQRVAAVFVITGIILMQIVRYKAGRKKDDKPDA